MFALAAVAILTKADSYALAIADVFAVFVGWRRRPAEERRGALPAIAVAALALVAPVIAWLGLAASLGRTAVNQIGSQNAPAFNVRQFLSYVWQFYLPRLGFMNKFRTTTKLPADEIWYSQGLGRVRLAVDRAAGVDLHRGPWIGGVISVVTIATPDPVARCPLGAAGLPGARLDRAPGGPPHHRLPRDHQRPGRVPGRSLHPARDRIARAGGRSDRLPDSGARSAGACAGWC